LALVAVAVSSRFWWQTVLAGGQIGGFATATGSRPPLEVAVDLPARLGAVLPFFLEGERLAWSLLALLALVAAGWSAARGRRQGWPTPLLFFSACLWIAPLGMVGLLGSTYQSPRYLTMLLPIFALLAAAGLRLVVAALARFIARPGWQMGLAALASLLLLAVGLPGAVAAAGSREKGFRSAFETVAAHWQPGDRLATVAPAYAQVVLDHCDYFALGLDYEEFVYRAEDGTWRDRWLGLPLLRSADELAALLDGGERLWLVTDEGRLRRRFDLAFAQLVWQRLTLVAKIDDVFVFGPYEPIEPAVSRPLAVTFGETIALTGYDLGQAVQRPADPGWGELVVQPGETLPLTLYWQAADPISTTYTVFVQLLAADGQRYAQADGPPLAGIQPMSHWLPGEVLPDRRTLDLPADLPPGRYRLAVGLYEPDGGDRLPVAGAGCGLQPEVLILDYVRRLAPGQSLPVGSGGDGPELRGEGDALRLLDHSLSAGVARPGETLALSLTWQALGPVGADYTVFVHLLDAQGQIWGQGDGPPLAGTYPTCFWDPGEVVVDERMVQIKPDTPPGTYRLTAGFYVLDSGRRLLAEDGDRLFLGQVEIEP
jgi:hypothetical protein